MPTVVEILCTKLKGEIGSRETYITKLISTLAEKGLLPGRTGFEIPEDENGIVQENIFGIPFIVEYNEPLSRWTILVEFHKYHSEQVSVVITSYEYSLCLENKYLEQLKIEVKSYLSENWKHIIWLRDDESAFLCQSLYPEIHKTESLARQLINELMVKRYGISWWESYIPEIIKTKYTSRHVGYRQVTENFKNIDSQLMSIDLSDLATIFSLEEKMWLPTQNDIISKHLTRQATISNDSLISLLQEQVSVKKKFWDEIFSRFLSEDFLKNFEYFEKNRNHVMHNKMIDRSAYTAIRLSIKKVEDELKKALASSDLHVLSQEEKEYLQQRTEAELRAYEDTELEFMQAESGVAILGSESIIDNFDECLENFYALFEGSVDFRLDLELGDYQGIENSTSSELLFYLRYKINAEELKVQYQILSIDDSQGGSSEIKIFFTDDPENSAVATFYNGEAAWNDEQAYYAPVTGEFLDSSQLKYLEEKLTEYIAEKFPHLRTRVDSYKYSIIKDGGCSPVADSVYCEECDSEYLCIDESYGKIGQCLNCGHLNEIKQCSKCDSYYGEFDFNELNLCDNCYQEFKKT